MSNVLQLPPQRPLKLLIAGGGTGGHVLAGIAVADAWRAKYGPSAPVLFVGARGGIEEKLVPRANYPLKLLSIGSLNNVGLGRKLKTFFQLPLALLDSATIIMSSKPDAVLGVGGYASGPLVLMARILGRRTAILEQNSIPGFTNRVLGRLVDRVCCAFDGMTKSFAAKKIRVTGNPVRGEIKPLPPAPRNPFVVFVFGGSQGAAGINSLVLEALPFLKDRFGVLRFIHQTGEKDFDRVSEGHIKAGSVARVEKFIHNMPEAYGLASLVVCRSGSSTLAEVAAVQRAAVLIPFPFASDDHQLANAHALADTGGAFLLQQQGAKGEDLARIIREMMDGPAKLSLMEKQVGRFYRPYAARDVVSAMTD